MKSIPNSLHYKNCGIGFGDIAINNDDEIESDFMQFEEGTDRFYIWDWFDERCPNNLHDGLLYANVEEED